MGKTWPTGPNDEPVGWFGTPLAGGVEYQDANYREAEEEPIPVAPTINWTPWKRADALTRLSVIGSFLLWIYRTTWGTFFLFLACCCAFSLVFWCILELKHREKLAKIDALMMRK